MTATTSTMSELQRVELAQQIADELTLARCSAQVSAQMQRVIKADVTLLNVLVLIDGRTLKLGQAIRLTRLRMRGVPAPSSRLVGRPGGAP